MEKARRCLIDKEKYEFIEKYINLYFSIVDVQLFYNPKPSEIIKDYF